MIDARSILERALAEAIAIAERLGATIPQSVFDKLEALKKVSAIVADYEVELTTAVVGYFNGEASLSRVRKVFSSAPRDYARDVYVEGMSEGGLSSDDLDEDDERHIDEWIETQLDHVEGLVDYVSTVKGKDVVDVAAKQRAILDRVSLWVKELRDLGGRGRLRAKDGELAVWELGDTEIHCPDCLANSRLKPHRVKWWRDADRLPRSKDLDCGGYNCDCTLRNPKTRKVLYP